MAHGLPGAMQHPQPRLHPTLTLVNSSTSGSACVYVCASTDVALCVQQCECMAHVCLSVHMVTGSGADIGLLVYQGICACAQVCLRRWPRLHIRTHMCTYFSYKSSCWAWWYSPATPSYTGGSQAQHLPKLQSESKASLGLRPSRDVKKELRI